MANFNQTILMGHLTRDPELKKVGEYDLAECAIAVNDPFGKKDADGKPPVYFTELVVWGKRAETFVKFLAKGSGVQIVGRLIQDRWEKDGVKRSKHYVNVTDFVFMPKGEGGRRDGAPEPTPPPTAAPADVPSDDDAVPF